MSRAEVLNLHKEYQPHFAVPDPRTPILVSEGEILSQLPILGNALRPVISNLRRPILIWIANGGKQFAEDLINNIPLVDEDRGFDVGIVQYRSRTGVEEHSKDGIVLDESVYPFPDVTDRDVLGLDDVLDSGETGCKFDGDVARRGGAVTDLAFAAVKPEVDAFKGLVRLHEIPKKIRIWALSSVQALWLKRYGMDNGVKATEEQDRAGRRIEVNWAFEKETYPEAYAYYLRQALLRDPEAAKRLG